MEKAEILIHSGQNGEIFEKFNIEGAGAIRAGYKYHEKVREDRADWFEGSTVIRDFNDRLTVDMRMRIGPIPRWREDQLPRPSQTE
jgi:hypothetical protein